MAELTEEESAKLIAAFNKLKIKPKADTAEDLEQWLKTFGTEGSVKVEPGAQASTTVITSSQQPRISLFYGDNIKGEATYAQWVYEVKCLLLEKTHKPEAISQAIRRSLRGEASNLARRLGICATIPEILDKFESVYGDVDTKEHLLSKFYSAKQGENENVTKWSCRLEDILSTAVERKLVEPDKVNEMLRNMFWQGLKPALKDISGYKFEKITDFDKLRVEIRKLEQDHLSSEPNVPHCSVSVDQKTENKDIKEMKSMIQSLTNTVQQLEEKVNSSQIVKPKEYNKGNSSRGRGKRQDDYRDNAQSQSYRAPRQNYGPQQYFQYPGQYQSPNQSQGQRFNRESQQKRYQPPNQRKGQDQIANETDQLYQNQGQNYGQNQAQGTFEPYQSEDFNRGPLCFRCRQYGHYQWRCPVRMDHSRAHLNWNKPMDRDFP